MDPPTISPVALRSLTSAYSLILSRPQDEPEITEKQSLAIVLQMWHISKEEFKHSTLQQISPGILERLLDIRYKRVDDDTHKSFETLCRELLFMNVKGSLALWTDRTRRPQDDELNRDIFKMFKKYIIDDGVKISLGDLTELLIFPIE